eukprot:817186-Pelagomonas_calceolata.AAC.1
MDTKAKSSFTVDNVIGKTQKYKYLGRIYGGEYVMCAGLVNQRWESIPVMISNFFAVCVSWVVARKLSPICEMARPEIHNEPRAVGQPHF